MGLLYPFCSQKLVLKTLTYRTYFMLQLICQFLLLLVQSLCLLLWNSSVIQFSLLHAQSFNEISLTEIISVGTYIYSLHVNFLHHTLSPIVYSAFTYLNFFQLERINYFNLQLIHILLSHAILVPKFHVALVQWLVPYFLSNKITILISTFTNGRIRQLWSRNQDTCRLQIQDDALQTLSERLLTKLKRHYSKIYIISIKIKTQMHHLLLFMRDESLFNCMELIICVFQLFHHMFYSLQLFIGLQCLILNKQKHISVAFNNVLR